MSKIQEKKAEEYIKLGELFFNYLNHWKWFAISIICCLILSFIYLKSQPYVFTTTSNILIKPDDTKSTSVSNVAMKSLGLGNLSTTEGIDDEIQIISSYTFIKKMCFDLELYKTYTQKKFPFDKSLYNTSPITVSVPEAIIDTLSAPILLYVNIKNKTGKIKIKHRKEDIGEYTISKFPGTIETSIGKFTFNSTKTLKEDDSFKLEIQINGLNSITEIYRKIIAIGAINKRANVISLSINDEHIQRGKDILNHLIKLYNEEALDDKNIKAQNATAFIKERIEYIFNDLNKIETDIEHYKTQNKFVDIATEAELFLKNMGSIQEKNVEFEIQSNVIKMIEEYLNTPQNDYSLIPASASMPESMIASIKEYNNAILERTRLLRNTNENNPIIISIDEQIGLLKNNVATSIQNAKKEINISKKDWNKEQSSVQSRIKEMPRQEREYIEKRRQQEIKSSLYIYLLEKLQEAEITLASNTPKARIIDAAYTQSIPISPRRTLTLAVSILIGIILPILLLWIKQALQFKLSTTTELEEKTSIPVLGEICKNKSGKNIVVTETSTTSITELFRLIRSNLQFVLTQKEEKVILVTSSISGEGKTFFAVNLAISLSLLKKKKVVMVGLDIRSPRLAEYLSINSRKGVTSFLADESYTPEDIIINLPEIHPDLSLIPAGPIPPNPSELLLNERLDSLFEYLRSKFDYIIVDTAPVAMISATFSLKRISDATIYLFRANYTNKSYLNHANAIVKDEKLKKVYMVMNSTETKSGYGYGYGNKQ